MGCIESQLDVFGSAAGYLGERASIDRGEVFEVLPLDRSDPLTANPVLVAWLESHERFGCAGGCIDGHVLTPVDVIVWDATAQLVPWPEL